MNLKEMIEEKDRIGISYEKLSQYSGLSVGALHKLFSGQTKNPRRATLNAIERVFNGLAKEDKNSKYLWKNAPIFPTDIGQQPMLKESTSTYGSSAYVNNNYSDNENSLKGSHTLEEYYRLPNDRRVELIDGEFFEMEAPNSLHQEIIAILQYHFTDFVRKNKGPCKVYSSPMDVQLDQDNRTMVQPDLLVVCDRDKISKFGIYGAPDFCLEVVSPSSSKKDIFLKSYKYANAGVREYWIIIPKEKKLLVYNFETGSLMQDMYSLTGSKGVAIWENRLEIDLDEIRQAIEEFDKL